jgi:hypothetical protein
MNEGWVKLQDPKSGKTFYANKTTKVTQWERPDGFVEEQENKPITQSNKNASSDSDLPPNWERLHDTASGRDFYVNHLTKKTQWDHPGTTTSHSEQFGTGHEDRNSQRYAHQNGFQDGINNNASEMNGMVTGFGFIPASRSEQDSNVTSTPTSLNHRKSTRVSWDTSQLPPGGTNGKGSPKNHLPLSYKSVSFARDDDLSSKYYKGTGPSSLKQIDFKVVQVSNLLRSSCPSCDAIFSISKRRHHCRLCGDIFCNECSNKKVLLPLAGPEFEKPVRVCDSCYTDVEKGNYFSMRRYLTPLQLFNPNDLKFSEDSTGKDGTDEESEIITYKNVAAALTSMSQDFDALLLDSSTYLEKMTIGADLLIPAISRHLKSQETSDRAIRALANVLTLGNIVDDTSYITAFYIQENADSYMNDVMNLLEWSGSSIKTIAVQEQAAKVVLTLTDPKIVSGILDIQETSGYSCISIIDIPRVIRSMLDHATNSNSPALQRWSSACIRNLITEDYRRACDAISEAMVMGMNDLKYQTVIGDMISSGGIMILSSLVTSEDTDTRENAISGLSAIIFSSRDLGTRLGVFKDAYLVNSIQLPSEASIIESILSSGACSSALTHLLLSADNQVALMGCEFARTLVSPLLTDPSGSLMVRYHRLFLNDSNNIVATTSDNLSVYRRASLELGSADGVLGGLIHLIHHPMSVTRPVQLKLCALEILASICISLADCDYKAKLAGGLEDEKLQNQISNAFTTLEEESIGEALLSVFSRTGIGALDTSRDSPSSQLQEISALTIAALSSCSEVLASSLMSKHILTPLITIALDDGFTIHSYRGEWAQRRLPMLEATASLLTQGWKTIQKNSLQVGNTPSTQESQMVLNYLMEALDGGIMRVLDNILSHTTDLDGTAGCTSDLRLKIAACHICAALFGIAICDSSHLGISRLFQALGNSQILITQILHLLSKVGAAFRHEKSSVNSGYTLALTSLLESLLLAAGSLCGAEVCSFNSLHISEDNKMIASKYSCTKKENDVFLDQFSEICIALSSVLLKMHSFITSALVGAFGEGSVMPMLRLLSVIALNGNVEVVQQLSRSGIILPLCDMIKGATIAGDYYTFDVIVDAIGIIGGDADSNAEHLHSLRECVKLLSNVIVIKENLAASSSETLPALKYKCIMTIEQLSRNSSLWNTIVANFIPIFNDHWVPTIDINNLSSEKIELIRAGLQTIARVVSIPSHATFVANTGVATILSSFVSEDNQYSSNERMAEVESLAVQILCTLLDQSTKDSSKGQLDPGMVNIYAYDVACIVLSRHEFPNTEIAVTLTRLGLHMIQKMLLSLRSVEKENIPSSPSVISFVESTLRHQHFVKRLCASILAKDVSHPFPSDKSFTIKPLYGEPLLILDDSAGSELLVNAAIQIMFYLTFFCSLSKANCPDTLWDIIMISDIDTTAEKVSRCMAVIALLSILLDAFMKDSRASSDSYFAFALPIVKTQLFYLLSLAGHDYSALISQHPDCATEIQQALDFYRVPHLCLELLKDDSLLETSFETIQIFFTKFPRFLVASIISDASSLKSLLNMLTATPSEKSFMRSDSIAKMNVFSAAVLSSAGEFGILGPSVNKLGLRSDAIACLSSACLSDNEYAEELNEDGKSMSVLCLYALLDVVSYREVKSSEKMVQLSDSEAKAISSILGNKLSSLTLERFVHKAANQESSGEGAFDLKKFPEITLLCALTSSKEALMELCNNGGLEALSLVAAEGDITTLNALREVSVYAFLILFALIDHIFTFLKLFSQVCKENPHLVLEVDGHISAMHVLSDEKSNDYTNNACFQLLIALCQKKDGLTKICASAGYGSCLDSTIKIVHDCSKIFIAGNSKMPLEKSDFTEIYVSAIQFLLLLLSNKERKLELIEDTDLLKSMKEIALNSTDPCIQYFAIAYFGACIRISCALNLSLHQSDSVSCTILSIIQSSPSRRSKGQSEKSSGITSYGDFGEMRHFNENLILASCFQILQVLFCKSAEQIQKEMLKLLEVSWKPMLQSLVVQKKSILRNRNAGFAMNNMMLLASMACSNRETNAWLIQNDSFIADLVDLVVANPFSEKISVQDEVVRVEKMFFRSAMAHALNAIAFLTSCPSRDWSSLFACIYNKSISSRLKAVRQQESPTFEDILLNISDTGEGSLASAALKILENIKL